MKNSCIAGLSLLLASVSVSQPAAAAVVDFGGLAATPNGSTFTTYAEDGFTLTSVSGTILVANNYGNPVPDLYFGGAAAFDITGGLFTLGAFDAGLGGSFGTSTYTVTGFLGGLQTFTQTLTNTSPAFNTLTPSSGLQTFDRVRFSLSTTSSSANIDNINLTMAAVPEPSTWAMMLVGFGAVGYGMRRRRAVSLVRFQSA